MNQTTRGGAIIAPIDVPVLIQPVATDRSLAGNHWLMAFMPAGKMVASRTPSRLRKKASAGQLEARPWSMLAMAQPNAKIAKPPALVRGGNPLLFPFIARHRVDGRIGLWRDAQGVVREVPMHGFVRDLPFDAQVDAQVHGVHMTLTDSAATRTGYPFSFRFEAVYRLVDETALDAELITTNAATAGATAMHDDRLPY